MIFIQKQFIKLYYNGYNYKSYIEYMIMKSPMEDVLDRHASVLIKSQHHDYVIFEKAGVLAGGEKTVYELDFDNNYHYFPKRATVEAKNTTIVFSEYRNIATTSVPNKAISTLSKATFFENEYFLFPEKDVIKIKIENTSSAVQQYVYRWEGLKVKRN